MEKDNCRKLLEQAEETAKCGKNSQAADLFHSAAECWKRWESFTKAAQAFERAYEHAMLAHRYTEAALFMREAGWSWISQGEHEKFEIDFQIAAEAYIYAAEEEHEPKRFIDGAFCAILGGDLDLARQLIHAAAETTKGQIKEQINLALMLSEYHFGDAYMYIEAALTRVLDKKGMADIREFFELAFAGFVRTSLEAEAALTISSLAESTGLEKPMVQRLVNRCMERGLIPAYSDPETMELVIDSERYDSSELGRRKGPILSRDLEDPGAWDMDLED
jgi:hypothetical protein